MEPFGDADLPVVMGHRGAPGRARENTPESFAAAAGDGATWVELDARRSADEVAMVHHDPHTADGTVLLGCTAAELRAVGVWDLETVVEQMPPGVGIDVELKNLPGQPDYDEQDRLAGMVAAALRPVAGTRPLLVSSFNPGTALAAAAALPGVPAGLLTVDTFEVVAAVDLAVELGFDVLCPNVAAPGIDATGIAAAHEAGLAVLVWTVDDTPRIRELAEAGADALCTNDPAAALEALGRGTRDR